MNWFTCVSPLKVSAIQLELSRKLAPNTEPLMDRKLRCMCERKWNSIYFRESWTISCEKGNEWNFPPPLCIIGFLLQSSLQQEKQSFFFASNFFAKLNLHAKFIGVEFLLQNQNSSGRVGVGKLAETTGGKRKVHLFYHSHAHTHTQIVELSLHNNCTQFGTICITLKGKVSPGVEF